MTQDQKNSNKRYIRQSFDKFKNRTDTIWNNPIWVKIGV